MRFQPRVIALREALDAGEVLARLRSRRALVALDSATTGCPASSRMFSGLMSRCTMF